MAVVIIPIVQGGGGCAITIVSRQWSSLSSPSGVVIFLSSRSFAGVVSCHFHRLWWGRGVVVDVVVTVVRDRDDGN